MLTAHVNEHRYPIDYYNIRKAVLLLRAINHKLRLRIISLIDENEEITVTELYLKLTIEQSIVSQHLAILRRAGIVRTKREGKRIYYTVNKEKIASIERLSKELVSDDA